MKKVLLGRYREESRSNYKENNMGCEVVVSWMRNVFDFFVQQVKNTETLIMVQMLLNESHLEKKESIKEDDLISSANDDNRFHIDFIPSQNQMVSARWGNNFYRARVLNVCMEEGNVEGVELMFIDYGNRALVSVSELNLLPEQLVHIPPLAIRCQLFGCLPKTGLSEECDQVFKDFFSNCTVKLEVLGRSGDVLEVDLVRDIIGLPTSLRDLLVLSDNATFYSNFLSGYIIPNVDNRKFKMITSFLTTGSHHDVIMSHVDYKEGLTLSLQLLSDPDQLALRLPRMMERMRKCYGARRGEEMWGLQYTPSPGTVCALVHKEGGQRLWYRAQVLGIVRGRLMEVLYVDFGNKELVSRHRLSRLFDQFLYLPALAVTVSLSGLSDNVGNIWLADQIRSHLSLCDLEMFVTREGTRDSLAQVEIKVESISVNSWVQDSLDEECVLARTV